MSEPTTTEESAALADAVAALLERIETGELTAGPAATPMQYGEAPSIGMIGESCAWIPLVAQC